MTTENAPGRDSDPKAKDVARDAAAHRIEKGWTVYDVAGRPVGNVTDVDMARQVLVVDGRPAGFDAFEVPMTLVSASGDGEVRLTQAVDVRDAATDNVPRFVASREAASASPKTDATRAPVQVRTEQRASHTAPGPVRAATTPATPATVATAANSTAPAPRATTTVHETGTRTVQYDWEQPRDEGGWSVGRIASGVLAVGGLVASAYFLRRRMRRKTKMEQATEALLAAYGGAAGFARDRHPAWWASLAAAALPAVYYAWPTRQPAATERVGQEVEELSGGVGGYTTALAAYVPSADDLSTSLQAAWRRAMPSDGFMAMRPDMTLTAGLLAASALAFYLSRRGRTRSTNGRRISDVMTRQPRVVQPDATVADAALMMRRLDVGALPVCDGSRLIGMLTDRDITLRSTADGRDPHLTPVRDIMTPGVAWASEDDPVEEAARIMREHQIRRLPIVNERHSLVGVVSLGDLAVDLDDTDLSGEALEKISEPSRPDR